MEMAYDVCQQYLTFAGRKKSRDQLDGSSAGRVVPGAYAITMRIPALAFRCVLEPFARVSVDYAFVPVQLTPPAVVSPLVPRRPVR
jgi:hypothetical protein